MTKSRQSREWHSLSPCFVELKIRDKFSCLGCVQMPPPPGGGKKGVGAQISTAELHPQLLVLCISSWSGTRDPPVSLH